jgi:hypothetical protein
MQLEQIAETIFQELMPAPIPAPRTQKSCRLIEDV